MVLEGVISMEPVKEKLKNLREHMRGEDEILYEFASYLAGKLNPELVPEGFILAYEFALEDLKREGNYGKYGRVTVPANLIGHPLAIYALLRMKIPDITKATCPPDFAEKVKTIYEEISKR